MFNEAQYLDCGIKAAPSVGQRKPWTRKTQCYDISKKRSSIRPKIK